MVQVEASNSTRDAPSRVATVRVDACCVLNFPCHAQKSLPIPCPPPKNIFLRAIPTLKKNQNLVCEFSFALARSSENIVFEALTISCGGRAATTREARGELADKECLAILSLVEDGRPPHGRPEVSLWIRSVYLLQRTSTGLD